MSVSAASRDPFLLPIHVLKWLSAHHAGKAASLRVRIVPEQLGVARKREVKPCAGARLFPPQGLPQGWAMWTRFARTLGAVPNMPRATPAHLQPGGFL